ncbi:zinc finger protein-domain-containing protein [Xylariaceae sp. FL1019]|nr:zinc finger protein-domain-containing protein [Xylariaceae sp. FL1019]
MNTTYSLVCRSLRPLSLIGAGFANVAIKREDGGRGRSLSNESDIHQQLLAARDRQGGALTFAITIWVCYVTADVAEAIVARFPSGYSPCNMLITERIPPLPASVRRMLIEEYCHPELPPELAYSTDSNKHACLIRPYLGKRRRWFDNTDFCMFSLRNHPLHLDQLEDLGLDLFTYSRPMAEALAFMHWCAKIDANGVEFVLAPRTFQRSMPQATLSSVLGDHCLWILDFDCCRPMTMDETGVEQAAAAFWRNDPYYPRPGQEIGRDVEQWALFKRSYLTESVRFIGPKDVNLPRLLLERIEAKAER